MAVKRINERFAGFDVLQVVAESARPDGIRNSETLELMQRFQRSWSEITSGGTFRCRPGAAGEPPLSRLA
jgi:hypothetical protein